MTKTVKDYIRTIADFPHEGIMFRDVTTLFADARGFRMAIDQLLHPYAGAPIDKVVGLEARGFILGGAVAHQLSTGFVPIRKKGKLPGAVIVKVHLANRTATARPYPAIQLTLTDREGETIGKRTYTAEDYATVADAGEIPANGVAVVSLHLAGPDENAVGFEASIVNTGT